MPGIADIRQEVTVSVCYDAGWIDIMDAMQLSLMLMLLLGC